jgi:lysozyme
MSNEHMELGPGYFRLIAHFERGPPNDPKCRLTVSGAALDAYLCPADVPTIGAGSIKRLDGSPVQMGDCITEAEVFQLAERDAKDAADAVRKIKRPLTQHQFEACTAFTHNLGEGNFRKIAPLIEDGRWEDAAEKMWEYVRAWGKREGHWYYQALLGLRIRRAAEALHLLGLPWAEVCDADNIGMPRKRIWQPDGIAKDGTRGRFFDELLPGATEFTTLETMAREELSRAAKPQPAPPVPGGQAAGAQEASPVPPVASAQKSPASVSAIPTAGVGQAAATPTRAEPSPVSKPAVVSARPAPAPVVLPSQVPKPPPEPPSLNQQRDAVNASGTPGIDPSSAKSMLLSRRFWGLFMIITGRLVFAFFGADTMLKLGSDPIISEMFANVMVMLASSAWEYCGEMLHTWGKARAKRPLR